MSTRVELQQAVIDYVEGVAYADPSLDVNAAALHLSSLYPQSGFHIQEICDMILAAAKERGVATVIGRYA